ncbi:MAG: gliding motility-associated ABC transporter permease subunit GldF [Chitinophagales bacterium]|nr:gliding motility-associated ABC transporter permease subunit GldF [Chitinophagales bacterium]OJV29942.1 MAG: gliding motility-associated ABC transporter permease subunit GldF [Bacteroidetes bacterium 37-13]
MWAIYIKEVRQFFSSLVGFLALLVFLLMLGLFLWIFPDTNILDFGYANIDGLFALSPYIFMLLIPAITMRSFSEELSTGTFELLVTRPVSELQIVGGKYLAAITLIAIALLPTLIYFITVYRVALPVGNVDTGGIAGSYIGLFLLGCVFAAIGIFASSVTPNQIVAFLFGVFLCFVLYQAFGYLSKLGIFFGKNDFIVEQLGIDAHYASMSKGVIDTRDLVYFFSVIAGFLLFTKTALSARKW